LIYDFDRQLERIDQVLRQNSLNIDLESLVYIVRQLGGVAIPAHIERERFSLISQLGFLNSQADYHAVEISKYNWKKKNYQFEDYLQGFPVISVSGSHFFEDICNFFIETKHEEIKDFISLKKYSESKNMKNIADHLFDILENSAKAGASEVKVKFSFLKKIFFCQIIDNGPGIISSNVVDPFITTRKTRRVGLGLPLLKKTAEDTLGYLKIIRLNKKGGTSLEFLINMFHIDAKPFGDLARVFIDVLIAWPQMNLKLIIPNNSIDNVILDSEKIKEELNLEAIYSSQIQNFIYETVKKELIEKGIDDQFSIEPKRKNS